MIALLIIIPLYLLAIMAIIDAIKATAVKLCGQYCAWRISDAAVTDKMQTEIIELWRPNLTKIQYALYKGGNLAPIMGWGYAYQFQSYAPPLEMSISMPGQTYTFRSFNGDTALMTEAVRVIRGSVKKERAEAVRLAKATKVKRPISIVAPQKATPGTYTPGLKLQPSF